MGGISGSTLPVSFPNSFEDRHFRKYSACLLPQLYRWPAFRELLPRSPSATLLKTGISGITLPLSFPNSFDGRHFGNYFPVLLPQLYRWPAFREVLCLSPSPTLLMTGISGSTLPLSFPNSLDDRHFRKYSLPFYLTICFILLINRNIANSFNQFCFFSSNFHIF